MNSIVDDFRRDEVRVLDRLVDGELCAAEERELLAALDDEPGAWRRCALAFLEARALRSDLHGARSAVLEVTPAARPRAKSNVWGMVFVSAASLMLSFFVGMQLRGLYRTNSGMGPVEIAQQDPTQQTTTLQNAAQQNTTQPQNLSVGEARRQADRDYRLTSARVVNPSPGKWETFKFNLGDGAEEIEVPAVEMAAVDPKWLENQGSAVPPDVIQYIESTGHEVRRQRTLLPIDLKDGRQLIVPVEQLELEYVGGSKYQ